MFILSYELEEVRIEEEHQHKHGNPTLNKSEEKILDLSRRRAAEENGEKAKLIEELADKIQEILYLKETIKILPDAKALEKQILHLKGKKCKLEVVSPNNSSITHKLKILFGRVWKQIMLKTRSGLLSLLLVQSVEFGG